MARGFVSRRVSQRAPFQAEIAISLETGGPEPVIASASNISAGGLQLNILQGKAKLPAEERLELVFDLPNLGETRVQGEIIYFNNSVDSENNKVTCYGIRFLDLSQETWNIINAYCHGLLDAQQPETAAPPRPAAAPVRSSGKGQAAHALKQDEIDQLLKNLLPQDGKKGAPAPRPAAPPPIPVPPPSPAPAAAVPPPSPAPAAAVPPPVPPPAEGPPPPVVETQSSLQEPAAAAPPPAAASAGGAGEKSLISNSLIDLVYGGGGPPAADSAGSEAAVPTVPTPLGPSEPPPPPAAPSSGPELVKSASMVSMDQAMIDQIIRSLQKDQSAPAAPPTVTPSLVPERPPETSEVPAGPSRPLAGAPPELEAAAAAAAAAVDSKIPLVKLRLQDGRELAGKIENLNFGGLMVRLTEPIPLNLSLQIQLTITGETLSDIPGTSTNCESIGGEKEEYLVGVFFENMDDTHFTKLRQLVGKFKP